MASKSFAVKIVVGTVDRASGPLRALAGGVRTAFGAIGHTLKIGLTAAAGTATAAITLGTREAALFESVLKDVELQAKATAAEMASIRADTLSSDFARMGKAGRDVAETYKRLAAEGYDVNKMRQMARPIVQSAIILGQEEGETTRLLLNLMQQYQLGAEGVAHISDVAANALANTSYQGNELAEVMKYAGLAAASLGWSMEETVAVTDAVIKRVGEASMAGTYFRQMIAALRDPTREMVEEFGRVGISLDEMAAATQDPLRLIALLQRAHGRGANFAKAFGVRAMDAALSLTQAEIPAMRELIETLGQTGTAHEYVEGKMRTARGQVQAMLAGIKNLGVEIGAFFTPIIRVAGPPVVGFLQDMADWIGRIAEKVQQRIEKGGLGDWLSDFFDTIIEKLPTTDEAIAKMEEWVARAKGWLSDVEGMPDKLNELADGGQAAIAMMETMRETASKLTAVLYATAAGYHTLAVGVHTLTMAAAKGMAFQEKADYWWKPASKKAKARERIAFYETWAEEAAGAAYVASEKAEHEWARAQQLWNVQVTVQGSVYADDLEQRIEGVIARNSRAAAY